MDVQALTVMIGSEQPEELARFYGEVLQLPAVPGYRDPVFRAGGASLRIIQHTAVQGRNVQPGRIQLNLFVADVQAEFQRLHAQGVRFVREPERESWGGIVATMEDPDGNFVQIIQERAG